MEPAPCRPGYFRWRAWRAHPPGSTRCLSLLSGISHNGLESNKRRLIRVVTLIQVDPVTELFVFRCHQQRWSSTARWRAGFSASRWTRRRGSPVPGNRLPVTIGPDRPVIIGRVLSPVVRRKGKVTAPHLGSRGGTQGCSSRRWWHGPACCCSIYRWCSWPAHRLPPKPWPEAWGRSAREIGGGLIRFPGQYSPCARKLSFAP